MVDVVDKMFKAKTGLRFRPGEMEDVVEIHASSKDSMMNKLNILRASFPDAKLVYSDAEFGMFPYWGVKLGELKDD